MLKYLKTFFEDEIETGDTVAYDAGVSTYTGTWKVLGIENGKIKLISTESVGEKTLSAKDGYLNGITYLNEFCEPFANGKGGSNARSLCYSLQEY